jgi:hypothetical protein
MSCLQIQDAKTGCTWQQQHGARDENGLETDWHKEHGGVIGWGFTLQSGMKHVRFPMVSLELFIDITLSSRTMSIESTQPLAEICSRNIS